MAAREAVAVVGGIQLARTWVGIPANVEDRDALIVTAVEGAVDHVSDLLALDLLDDSVTIKPRWRSAVLAALVSLYHGEPLDALTIRRLST